MFQSQQQQFMNYNESGVVEQNENTMYADMTVVNNRMYNQQNKTAFGAMSYLTSPQKMSTPIAMRTKDISNSGKF